MKNAGGTKTKYYYDGFNTLLTREKPGGGSCWRTKTVYALENKAIGQVMATRDYEYAGTSCTPSDHEDTWYKYDHIGNVMATFDDAGALKSNIEMEAFGKVRSGTPGRVQLTTKEFHPDANLYYFGARWYDQVSGRWMEKEPLGKDGPNWYNFSNWNPNSFYDSNGLFINKPTNWFIPTCMWNIMEEVDARYSEAGGSDKFMHCLVSCRAAQECGVISGMAGPTVLGGGILWEITGGGVFDWGDIAADAFGSAGGGLPGCCEQKCANKYGAPSLR